MSFVPFDHRSTLQQLEQQLLAGSLILPALGIRDSSDPYNFTQLQIWRCKTGDKKGTHKLSLLKEKKCTLLALSFFFLLANVSLYSKCELPFSVKLVS